MRYLSRRFCGPSTNFVVLSVFFYGLNQIDTTNFALTIVSMGNDVETVKQRAGKIIREKRIAAGFKRQGAFAEALGCDQSRVSMWESGKELPDRFYRDKMHALIKTVESDFEGVVSLNVDSRILSTLEQAAESVFSKYRSKLELPTDESGLSENHRKLISIVPTLSDARVRMLLELLDENAVLSDENEGPSTVARKS